MTLDLDTLEMFDMWLREEEAIEAEARAPLEARIAALEGALREWWTLWDAYGPGSGRYRPGPLESIPGDMRDRHVALLAATPPPAPPTLDVERLLLALVNVGSHPDGCEWSDHHNPDFAAALAAEYAALAPEATPEPGG